MQLATQAPMARATPEDPKRPDPWTTVNRHQHRPPRRRDPDALAALKQILFKPATRQKLLAFASLLVLMIFFSFASPNFLQTDNMVSILQATAVNGVLAIACTFVIITAGIDLSVGTLMTFCAVMAGVFLTYWGMPLWTGIVAAIFFRRALRLRLRRADRQAENPAVHRDARHDAAAQGLVAGDLRHQADLLQRHARLPGDLAGFADRLLSFLRCRSPTRC